VDVGVNLKIMEFVISEEKKRILTKIYLMVRLFNIVDRIADDTYFGGNRRHYQEWTIKQWTSVFNSSLRHKYVV
jgi:hypothetical protein